MSTITQRFIQTVFTATEINLFSLCGIKFHWHKLTALVRPITKGLRLALTT